MLFFSVLFVCGDCLVFVVSGLMLEMAYGSRGLHLKRQQSEGTIFIFVRAGVVPGATLAGVSVVDVMTRRWRDYARSGYAGIDHFLSCAGRERPPKPRRPPSTV